MTGHTHDFADWPFPDPVQTMAFCTDKVVHQGFPVLQVAHDHDGDWQFLDATTDDPGHPVLLCMGCVFERDPTLQEIGDLPRGWSAFRPHVGAEWERWQNPPEEDEEDEADSVDERDRRALENIEAYGLHFINVMAEDDLPPFSYSIGIGQSLGMPELIVIGLTGELAHSMINECYRQMRDGLRMAPGTHVAGLLGGGFECVIGDVSPTHFRDYMGGALWLYKGPNFRAWQIIYPTTTGIFPWESDASASFRALQPLLAAAVVQTSMTGPVAR